MDIDIKEIGARYEEYVKQLRREFHQIPELSFEEFETSAKIAEELDKMGITYRRCGAKTGWLASIGGKKPGKTVLLRADIDALPVHEKTGVEWASRHEGVMHACGHDTHIAMVLGACRILKDMEEELNGTVKVAFQPAEEISTGSRTMIEEGALEGVDAVFAMHTWGNVPTGTICADPGEAMAGCGRFFIDIEGKASHGSEPENGVDVALTAAAVIMNLQSVASREISPLTPAVVTVGRVEIPGSWNIMTNKAELEGTTRCFDPAVADRFEEIITRIVTETCAAYRAKGTVRYMTNTLPVVNDPKLAAIARAAAVKVVGEDGIVHMGRISSSEDFCYFMAPASKVPGVQAFLGSGCDLANHNEAFLPKEEILIRGAEMYSRFAVDFLNA